MVFVDGEESEKECPVCKTKLYQEISFKDYFSYKNGHYTVDYPILVCPNCNYSEDVEPVDEVDFDE